MSRSEYVELDTIHDPEGMGLVSHITMRKKPSGYLVYSFAIFKEFERNEGGPTQRTSYLTDRHFGALRKLVDLTEERIRVEQDKMHTGRRAVR